jgi:branched-chain amino acid transport system permease protein
LIAVFNQGFPPGILLTGVILGALSSLTSMGMVMIYKSTRIINFAQSAIGGLAGAFAILATQGWGLNYYESFVIGLLIAAITGVLIELGVMSRLRNAPRLILIVATLGLFQILDSAEIGLPHIVSGLNTSAQYNPPFNISFHIGAIPFNSSDVVALIVAPIILFVLWLFLNKTSWGIAMRAMGDSPERTMLLGISVGKLSLITWVAASCLSGIASLLTAPIIQPSLGTATSPAELLLPLAALTLAGFDSLFLAAIWSIILSVVEQFIFWNYPSTNTVNVLLFLVIAVALLTRRGREFRSEAGSLLSEYVAIRAVKPLAQSLAQYKEIKIAKYSLYVIGILLAAIIPIFLKPASQDLLGFVAIYAIVAVSLVVITGWAGQVSLGQFAFVGIGAATCATFLVRLHADFFVSLIFSGIIAAIISVVIGIPALRLPGLTLAAVSFGFAIAVSSWLLSNATFPYINPAIVNRPKLFGHISLYSDITYYELTLAVLVICIICVYNFKRTRTGRAIRAMRDNESATSVYGISPFKTKIIAFGLSGALAGIAGALYVLATGGIGATGLDPNESIIVFTMVVVGGLGSTTGALLGALYVELISYFLPPGWELFASGGGLLLLLLVLPEGIGGLIFKLRDYLLTNVILPKVKSQKTSEIYEESGANEKIHLGALRFQALEDIELSHTAAPALSEDGQNAALQIISLKVQYDHATILFNIDFNIKDGEILALLGTNGSGKSTALRAICGLTKPTEGKIIYKGKDLTNIAPSERVKLGVVGVFGGKSTFASLSVKENLYLAQSEHRKLKRQSDVGLKNIFEMFPPLAERLNIKAGLLSGGEQQMLGIAMAMLLNPDVLMIDELSLGLSPIVVQSLTQAVKNYCFGRCGLVIEQSVNVAASISKRAVFLERGKVRFSGPTPQLKDQPRLLRSVFLNAAQRSLQSQQDETQSKKVHWSKESKIITLKNVTRHYQGINALDEVNLSVLPGEILGIIGPNGAGKTTLLHACSGLIKPSAGKILFAVRSKSKETFRIKDITHMSADKRASFGMGTVFQNAALFSSLTTFETICVALEKQVEVKDPFLSLFNTKAVRDSEKVVKQKAKEVISMLGLERFTDNFIFELSTGTRRIVELGCVMAHQPSLILLDEPSSGIAQKETEALRDVLIGLRETTGASFIIVEHDVPLISYVADRLVCMNMGKIIADGLPSEVLTNSAVIESYLGTREAELV